MVGWLVGSYILIGGIYIVILELLGAFDTGVETLLDTINVEYDTDSVLVMFIKGLYQFGIFVIWPVMIAITILAMIYATKVMNNKENPT